MCSLPMINNTARQCNAQSIVVSERKGDRCSALLYGTGTWHHISPPSHNAAHGDYHCQGNRPGLINGGANNHHGHGQRHLTQSSVSRLNDAESLPDRRCHPLLPPIASNAHSKSIFHQHGDGANRYHCSPDVLAGAVDKCFPSTRYDPNMFGDNTLFVSNTDMKIQIHPDKNNVSNFLLVAWPYCSMHKCVFTYCFHTGHIRQKIE